MRCTCGADIEEGEPYYAVFQAEHGFRVEMGCAHHTPDNIEAAVATLGSGGCMMGWLHGWLADTGEAAGPPS